MIACTRGLVRPASLRQVGRRLASSNSKSSLTRPRKRRPNHAPAAEPVPEPKGFKFPSIYKPLDTGSSAAPSNPAIQPRRSPRPLPYRHSAANAPPTSDDTSSHSADPEPQTILTIWRTSWLPLTGAVLAAGALGFYLVGTFTASLKASSPCAHHDHAASTFSPSKDAPSPDAIPTGRPPALTGANAEQFDRELDLPEWWMGITKLRRLVASRAGGHVLELAVGSGRNLEYYDWEPLNSAVAGHRPRARTTSDEGPGLASFTGLDISVDMLDVARRRLVKSVPPMASAPALATAATMADHTGGQLSFLDGHLRLVNSDAHHPLPPPPTSSSSQSTPNQKYDTIVQTFGLCSVSDPVAVLRNLASAVKPESGRIILLEHGQGWFGLVNGLLDRNAGEHFAKYGCWWNRDIQALVEEAARRTPGLEVMSVERPNVTQMGTLLLIEMRVGGGDASGTAPAQ